MIYILYYCDTKFSNKIVMVIEHNPAQNLLDLAIPGLGLSISPGWQKEEWEMVQWHNIVESKDPECDFFKVKNKKKEDKNGRNLNFENRSIVDS